MASEDAQLLLPRVFPAELAALLAPFQEEVPAPPGGTRLRLAQGWLCVLIRPCGDKLQWWPPLALPYRGALTKGLASSWSGVCPCLLPLVLLPARGEWLEPVRIPIHSLAGLAEPGAGVRSLVTRPHRASLCRGLHAAHVT